MCVCVRECVCMCVCERERERERESVCVCVRERDSRFTSLNITYMINYTCGSFRCTLFCGVNLRTSSSVE